MLIIEIIIAIFLVAAFLHFKITKKNLNFKTTLLTDSLVGSDEIKRTLAMGLYLRFRRENEKDIHVVDENAIFIKQDPITFETFIAEVFESARGGNTWVSPPSTSSIVDSSVAIFPASISIKSCHSFFNSLLVDTFNSY